MKGWWFPPPPKAPQPQRRSRCLCWVNGCRRCGGGSDKRFGRTGAAPLWADAVLGPPLRVGPVTDARPHLWVRAYRRRPGPIYGSDPRPHPPLPTSHPADEAHTTSPTHPLYSAIGALRGHSRPHRPPHGSPTDPIGGGREVGGGLATNKLSSRPPGGGVGGGQEGSRLPLAQQEGGGLPRTAEGMQSSPIWSQCLPAPPRDAPPHSAGLVPTAPLRDSRGGRGGGGDNRAARCDPSAPQSLSLSV